MSCECDFSPRVTLVALHKAFKRSPHEGIQAIGLELDNLKTRVEEIFWPNKAYFKVDFKEKNGRLFWKKYTRPVIHCLMRGISLLEQDGADPEKIRQEEVVLEVFRLLEPKLIELKDGEAIQSLALRDVDPVTGISFVQIERKNGRLIGQYRLLPFEELREMGQFTILMERRGAKLDLGINLGEGLSPLLTWVVKGRAIDFKQELPGLIEQSMQVDAAPVVDVRQPREWRLENPMLWFRPEQLHVRSGEFMNDTGVAEVDGVHSGGGQRSVDKRVNDGIWPAGFWFTVREVRDGITATGEVDVDVRVEELDIGGLVNNGGGETGGNRSGGSGDGEERGEPERVMANKGRISELMEEVIIESVEVTGYPEEISVASNDLVVEPVVGRVDVELAEYQEWKSVGVGSVDERIEEIITGDIEVVEDTEAEVLEGVVAEIDGVHLESEQGREETRTDGEREEAEDLVESTEILVYAAGRARQKEEVETEGLEIEKEDYGGRGVKDKIVWLRQSLARVWRVNKQSTNLGWLVHGMALMQFDGVDKSRFDGVVSGQMSQWRLSPVRMWADRVTQKFKQVKDGFVRGVFGAYRQLFATV